MLVDLHYNTGYCVVLARFEIIVGAFPAYSEVVDLISEL